jgi:hypothetical protein
MRKDTRTDGRTDGYTGRHYEVAFRNFAKAPKSQYSPPPTPYVGVCLIPTINNNNFSQQY